MGVSVTDGVWIHNRLSLGQLGDMCPLSLNPRLIFALRSEHEFEFSLFCVSLVFTISYSILCLVSMFWFQISICISGCILWLNSFGQTYVTVPCPHLNQKPYFLSKSRYPILTDSDIPAGPVNGFDHMIPHLQFLASFLLCFFLFWFSMINFKLSQDDYWIPTSKIVAQLSRVRTGGNIVSFKKDMQLSCNNCRFYSSAHGGLVGCPIPDLPRFTQWPETESHWQRRRLNSSSAE